MFLGQLSQKHGAECPIRVGQFLSPYTPFANTHDTPLLSPPTHTARTYLQQDKSPCIEAQ